VGTSREENEAFIYLSRHFASKQLPVPEVLAASNDNLCYLQTDLGATSLFDAIRAGREAGGKYNEQERELLRRTIQELPRLQFVGHEGLDYSHCYPQPQFDQEGIFFDLNYFKYCFLKATDIDFHEVRLEADFHALARDLLAEPSASFLYRDFQARNVMVNIQCSMFNVQCSMLNETTLLSSSRLVFLLFFCRREVDSLFCLLLGSC
jgi:aminoglycoside/choline kinase family phosphotransferase